MTKILYYMQERKLLSINWKRTKFVNWKQKWLKM